MAESELGVIYPSAMKKRLEIESILSELFSSSFPSPNKSQNNNFVSNQPWDDNDNYFNKYQNGHSQGEDGSRKRVRDSSDRSVSRIAKEQRLMGLVNELQREIHKMRALEKTTTSTLWKGRLAKIESESDSIRTTMIRHFDGINKQLVEVMKDEEMRNSIFGDNYFEKRKDEMRMRSAEACYLDEKEKLESSTRTLRDLINQGKAVTQNLFSQNVILRENKLKMNAASDSVSVSSSIIGIVERRIKTDRYLVYGGMIFVLFFIHFLYCWSKGIHPFWFYPSFLVPRLTLISRLISSKSKSTSPNLIK